MVALQEVNASSNTQHVQKTSVEKAALGSSVLRLSLEWEFELRSTAAVG